MSYFDPHVLALQPHDTPLDGDALDASVDRDFVGFTYVAPGEMQIQVA